MFLKRKLLVALGAESEQPSAGVVVSQLSVELRNGTLYSSSYPVHFENDATKRLMPNLTPSLTMLIIFVIPTILILLCLLIGYFCRKWAQERGDSLQRYISRTDEVDHGVSSSAPITPPPAYPDDKPPSYDEALKFENELTSPNTTISQSQQRLC